MELQKSYDLKSITPDNGYGFARPSDVTICPAFYEHAYVSLMGGSTVYYNRMIRRHLPKGTTKTTPEELYAIVYWMNNYPRKMFNHKRYYDTSVLVQHGLESND